MPKPGREERDLHCPYLLSLVTAVTLHRVHCCLLPLVFLGAQRGRVEGIARRAVGRQATVKNSHVVVAKHAEHPERKVQGRRTVLASPCLLRFRDICNDSAVTNENRL